MVGERSTHPLRKSSVLYRHDLFAGKIALVTGGRSGIGFAIAKLYLQLGAKVTIAARKQAPLQAACDELCTVGECDQKVCDIREPDQVAALADQIADRHGRLDILVNNAGGQFPTATETLSPKGWAAVINNNLNGTFYVCQRMASSFFIPQTDGVIVNIIANIARGFPGMAHTGAARAGVENLTKSLAQEWAEYNIRVNAVAPGVIESSGLDTYPDAIRSYFDSARKANLMRRFGTPEEVANAVMFYSSPLSSYISGTTLYVDGLDHLGGNNMRMYQQIKSLSQND
jgi:citronellol/citronellal dehydrogenase